MVGVGLRHGHENASSQGRRGLSRGCYEEELDICVPTCKVLSIVARDRASATTGRRHDAQRPALMLIFYCRERAVVSRPGISGQNERDAIAKARENSIRARKSCLELVGSRKSEAAPAPRNDVTHPHPVLYSAPPPLCLELQHHQRKDMQLSIKRLATARLWQRVPFKVLTRGSGHFYRGMMTCPEPVRSVSVSCTCSIPCSLACHLILRLSSSLHLSLPTLSNSTAETLRLSTAWLSLTSA
jgi:hypothetical protein